MDIRILKRHFALSLIFLGAAVSSSATSPAPAPTSPPDEKPYFELRSGAGWKVLSEDPHSPSVKSSMDREDVDTYLLFHSSAVDELAREELLPLPEIQRLRREALKSAEIAESGAALYVLHLEALEKAEEAFCDFGWKDPEVRSYQWDLAESPEIAESINVHGIEGSVSLSLPIAAEIQADVTYQVKVACDIPYKLRLLNVRAHGGVDLDGQFLARLGFEYTEQWSWRKTLADIPLASLTLGPFPIRVSIDLALSAGIDASVRVAGEAGYEANLEGEIDFDIECTAELCSDVETNLTSQFGFSDALTYELTLDAKARLWGRAAIELDVVHEDLAHAWIGATGYLDGRVFGYIGNTCGDADGDGDGDTLEDLLVDVGGGFTIDAGLGGYLLPEETWILYEDYENLWLFDLWQDSQGYDLLEPVVVGPRVVDVGDLVEYAISTRPCYPFDDAIQATWFGPATGHGELVPRVGEAEASGTVEWGQDAQIIAFETDAAGREIDIVKAIPLKVSTTFGHVEALENGVAEEPLEGVVGEGRYFVSEVPPWASNLAFELSGGTGNANIFVRKGELPTLNGSDCASTGPGNSELCTGFTGPPEGTYFVLVHGGGAFEDASLVARFDEPSGADLVPGIAVEVSGTAESLTYFTLEVPLGAEELTFLLDGGSGDADLFIRHGEWPTLDYFDCSSRGPQNTETCVWATPQRGRYHVLVHGSSSFADATLVANYDVPVGGGLLVNGEPVEGISGPAGGSGLWRLDVPEGASDLVVELRGGTGDADLYLRQGATPDRLVNDCASQSQGSGESCAERRPEAGPWYVLVYGFTDFSGVTLEATFSEAQVLANAGRVTSQGDAGSETFFVFDVPEGASDPVFELTGGTGDADLYVRYDEPPTRLIYDCRSANTANEERCDSISAGAGRYHVMVYGFTAYAGVTLHASYDGGQEVQELVNGVSLTEISGSVGSERFFSLSVPPEASELVFQITGGTGDADLYTRWGHLPTQSDYDCVSWRDGNQESCASSSPIEGTYYVMVHGHGPYDELNLVATYALATSEGGNLENGETVHDLTASEEEAVIFSLEIPQGASDLSVQIFDGHGEPDLFVRFAEPPTPLEFDCRSVGLGSEHECTVAAPLAGIYYFRVHGFGAFSGVSLTAEYQTGATLFVDGFESGDLSRWSVTPP